MNIMTNIMAKQLKMSTYLDVPAGWHDREIKATISFIVDDDNDVEASCHDTRPVIALSNGKLYNTRSKKEIRQQKRKNGYMIANIPKPMGAKGKETMYVHRVVWQCFKGEIPAGLQMDHINDVRDDNRLENLQLLTPRENSRKAAKRSGWIPLKHRPVIPVVATCLDECQQKEFPSISQAAKVLAVRSKCISDIIAGKQMTTKAIDGRCYTFHRSI